jgi:hypothetical protein
MARRSTNSLICVVLIFLSACSSIYSASNHKKAFKCLSLDPTKDYIFYEVIRSRDEYETWALSVSDQKSVMLSKQASLIQLPPPPHGIWLTIDKNNIAVLNLDSCQSEPVYRLDSKYKSFYTAWLNNGLLLINAFEEYPFLPDLFILDIKTGSTKQLASDEFIQATTTNQSTWIQSDSVSLEIVQWPNSPKRILNDFKVAADISPGSIEFIPHSDEFVFVAAKEGETDYKVWKTSINQKEPILLFDPDEHSGFEYYQISPNGRHFGFVLQTQDGYSLNFLNLKTNQIDFRWPYPITRTNPEFRWSSDSKFIVMLYEDTSNETSSDLFEGLQIMEISSGKLEVLLLSEIDWLIGWYAGK